MILILARWFIRINLYPSSDKHFMRTSLLFHRLLWHVDTKRPLLDISLFVFWLTFPILNAHA